MDELIERLKRWHEEDEHQSIVDAILRIADDERDYLLNGLLGRAYNNLDLYDEALEVLLQYAADGRDDAIWNHRVGYSYFYKDEEATAKKYFERACELDPDDSDSRDLLGWCEETLAKKTSAYTFIERGNAFWSWFLENEEKLSDMVENNKEYETDDIVSFVSDGVGIISDELHFNIGGNHEFTFTVEQRDYLFYLLPWLCSRMPAELRGKWKAFPYMQSTGGNSFGFGMYDARLKTDDVMVFAEYDEASNTFNLRFYEENLCALEDDECYSAFRVVSKITVGEGLARVYINNLEKAAEVEAGMIPLTELEKYMLDIIEKSGRQLITRPDERYSVYSLTPEEGPLRYDVTSGASCFTRLVAEYYRGETETANSFAELGAQAMFLSTPAGENPLELRHELEDALETEVLGVRGSGEEIGIVLGGAIGTENIYIDVLLYDKLLFEMRARDFLAGYKQSFLLCGFSQNGSRLKMTEQQPSEEEEQL